MRQVKPATLVEAARAASERAYAPYSGLRVGAALLGQDGRVFTGCNVENASLGLTMCAERTALACAVAAGQHKFRALAVYVEAEEPAPPCGACRQVLREFAADMPIYLAGRDGAVRQVSLAALYPMPFESAALRARGGD